MPPLGLVDPRLRVSAGTEAPHALTGPLWTTIWGVSAGIDTLAYPHCALVAPHLAVSAETEALACPHWPLWPTFCELLLELMPSHAPTGPLWIPIW